MGAARPTPPRPYVQGRAGAPRLADRRRRGRARGWPAPSRAGSAASAPAATTGSGAFLLETRRRRAAGGAGRAGGGARQPARAALHREDVAAGLDELPGARLDPRAARCLQRAAGRPRARARDAGADASASASRASSSRSTGTRTRSRPSSRCPAAEAHGRTLPIDPYLLEPLEHYLRQFERRRRRTTRWLALQELRVEHDKAIGEVRRSRAKEAPPLAIEDRLGGELQAVPARRRALRARGAPRLHRRRAGARQDRRGAGRAGGGRRVPGRDRLPGDA